MRFVGVYATNNGSIDGKGINSTLSGRFRG